MSRCMTVNGRDLPGRNFYMGDVIDKALRARNKKPWSRKTHVYHPSAIGMCRRSLYYDRVGIPPVSRIDAALAMIFLLGHAAHDVLQTLIREALKSFTAEIAFTLDLHDSDGVVSGNGDPVLMSGHTDGVFFFEDWLAEIKTINPDSFKTLVRPDAKHLKQIHCYMRAMDIPRAQIVYVNKSSGARRVFRVYFSKELWREILKEINYIEECILDDVVPDRDVSYFGCRSCKFQHFCKPREERT